MTLITALLTGGRPPYTLLANLGFVAASGAHGWMSGVPFRASAGMVRIMGPLIAVATHLGVALLLSRFLPEAYAPQIDVVGKVAYWEDYLVLILGYWPGAAVASLAGAFSVRRAP